MKLSVRIFPLKELIVKWNVAYSFCFSLHRLEILSKKDDTGVHMCAAADVWE